MPIPTLPDVMEIQAHINPFKSRSGTTTEEDKHV